MSLEEAKKKLSEQLKNGNRKGKTSKYIGKEARWLDVVKNDLKTSYL